MVWLSTLSIIVQYIHPLFPWIFYASFVQVVKFKWVWPWKCDKHEILRCLVLHLTEHIYMWHKGILQWGSGHVLVDTMIVKACSLKMEVSSIWALCVYQHMFKPSKPHTRILKWFLEWSPTLWSRECQKLKFPLLSLCSQAMWHFSITLLYYVHFPTYNNIV